MYVQCTVKFGHPNCCNYPKIGTVSFYYQVIGLNDADGMANSADPDQIAPREEQSDLGLHCLPRPVCPFRIITVNDRIKGCQYQLTHQTYQEQSQ